MAFEVPECQASSILRAMFLQQGTPLREAPAGWAGLENVSPLTGDWWICAHARAQHDGSLSERHNFRRSQPERRVK